MISSLLFLGNLTLPGVLLTWYDVAYGFTSICATESFCSDSAVKQILLTMNEKESFIIEDLDDFHLIIKADEEQRVRRELEVEVRQALFRTTPFKDVHSSKRTLLAWSDMKLVMDSSTRMELTHPLPEKELDDLTVKNSCIDPAVKRRSYERVSTHSFPKLMQQSTSDSFVSSEEKLLSVKKSRFVSVHAFPQFLNFTIVSMCSECLSGFGFAVPFPLPQEKL